MRILNTNLLLVVLKKKKKKANVEITVSFTSLFLLSVRTERCSESLETETLREEIRGVYWSFSELKKFVISLYVNDGVCLAYFSVFLLSKNLLMILLYATEKIILIYKLQNEQDYIQI